MTQSRKMTERTRKLLYPAIAAALLAATAATAYAAGPTLKMQKNGEPKISVKLGCAHAGSPSEFPDDIKITNNSVIWLRAGTKVKWTMPSVNKSGIVSLPALGPGKTAFFAGVVTPMPAGVYCTANTI